MSHFVIYDEIDQFVEKQPNMAFEGWDVLITRKDYAGWMKKAGVQVDGFWHTQKRVSCDTQGRWIFDDRDVNVVNSR
jgi:hypothetical protein